MILEGFLVPMKVLGYEDTLGDSDLLLAAVFFVVHSKALLEHDILGVYHVLAVLGPGKQTVYRIRLVLMNFDQNCTRFFSRSDRDPHHLRAPCGSAGTSTVALPEAPLAPHDARTNTIRNIVVELFDVRRQCTTGFQLGPLLLMSKHSQ